MLVDKPAGVSSHDVVATVRRALHERRVGHLGTLDPFATGLLVLLVGRATRLAGYVAGEPKVYEAVVRFGSETDTDDVTGQPTRHAPPPEPARVRAAIAELTGDVEQLPPAYSAKKVAGERAYAAAREGRPLALKPVRVTVHRWEVHELDADRARVEITCAGGTYIRALARDLGRLAGSAAHLEALRRTASGPFRVADAMPPSALAAGSPLRPLLDGLPHLAHDRLDADGVRRVSHGMPVAATAPGERAALLDDAGAVVAIAEREGDRWRPRVVLRDG